MRRLIAEVFDPFRYRGKPHMPLILVFVLINALVLVNAVLHDPAKGYDASDHIHYFKTLAEDHRIPTCTDSAQCYIPPLPYLLPAIILSTGRFTLFETAKLAQLANVFISLGLTYYLLKISLLLDPEGIILRVSSLSMFGILPVYYKTFSLIRGEVYLPLLVAFITWMLLSIFVLGKANAASLILLGAGMALAVLARQWGFLILPAILVFLVFVWLKDHSKLLTAVYAGAACLLIPLILTGWYFLIMYQRYGSITAWDRPASRISLSDFPPEFYFGLGSGKLFTDPIRPSFSNQFPAIFYSDTWGDYSAYFLVYVKDKTTGTYMGGKDMERVLVPGQPVPPTLETNRFTINSYLGRVNLVSLIPSAIFLAGLVYGVVLVWRALRSRSQERQGYGALLFLFIIACSFAGYWWYLLRFQNHGQGGDLIKATHMMQVFPFMGLLAGQALQKLNQKSTKLWLGIMVILALVFVHNLPAMITHYPLFP